MVQGLRIGTLQRPDLVHRGCIRGFMQCRRDSLFSLWSNCRREPCALTSLVTDSHSCNIVIPHQPEAAATWYRHGRCRRRPRPPPPRRRPCRLPPIPLSPFLILLFSSRSARLALQFSQASQAGNDGGIITRIANLLPSSACFLLLFLSLRFRKISVF